jgi:hypothetical protein
LPSGSLTQPPRSAPSRKSCGGAAARAWQQAEREAARESIAKLGRTGLAIYQVAQLTAAADMPTAPPAELYERFIAWTRNGAAR